MDDLKKFSAQMIAGLKGADTTAGTGNAIVDNFARSSFVDTISDQGRGLGNLASEVGAQEKEAAEAARRAEMQRIKDKMDPNKYQARKDREDGGYSFYDPEGNAIDINRYASATGANPAKILADSDNPFDRQYVNDYSNTRDLITAIQNGDSDTINAYKAENKNIGTMKPEDVMRELIRKYPHIYSNKSRYADSYRQSNNNPLLRYNLGGAPVGGGSASGGSSGGTRDWNS